MSQSWCPSGSLSKPKEVTDLFISDNLSKFQIAPFYQDSALPLTRVLWALNKMSGVNREKGATLSLISALTLTSCCWVEYGHSLMNHFAQMVLVRLKWFNRYLVLTPTPLSFSLCSGGHQNSGQDPAGRWEPEEDLQGGADHEDAEAPPHHSSLPGQ